MRYPVTHRFLKWAGPTLVVFVGGCIALVAGLAQGFPDIRPWAERQFYHWRPFVTAPWFLAAAAVVICAYLWAVIWTARPAKDRRGVTLFGYGLEHAQVRFEPKDGRTLEKRFFPQPDRVDGLAERYSGPPPKRRNDQSAEFVEAIAALRHLVTARDLWWASNREARAMLERQVAGIVASIRTFFPPRAPANAKEDQFSRLYNAAIDYGATLAHSGTNPIRFPAVQETFENEVNVTTEHFRRLNPNARLPATSPEKKLRDITLREGLIYAASGQWEAGDQFLDFPALGSALDRFYSRARDGALTVWGRPVNLAFMLWRPIPPDHWLTHEIVLARLHREDGAVSAPRVGVAAGQPYREIMANRAEFEQEWPHAG